MQKKKSFKGQMNICELPQTASELTPAYLHLWVMTG